MLICILLSENIEILYLFAKNDVRVNKKLKIKFDALEDDFVLKGKLCSLSLSHRKMNKAMNTLYIIIL